MKKFNFAFLGLTAIMTIAGCAAAKSVTAANTEVSKYQVPASKINLRRKSKALYINESYKLEPLIRPFTAYNAHLNYSSSNPDIASVDETGKVTAKSGGTAIISVYTDNYDPENPDEDLIDEFEVACLKKSSFANICGQGKAADQMLTLQASLPEVDSAILHDHRTYALLKNGKTVSDSTTEYQTYVVSKSLGLISYDSIQLDIDVLNGGESFTEYGYSFQTNANFGSFIYHRNDNVKKFFYAATEFNKGKEGATRYSTILEVIGSIFSVPGTYFTSAVDDILETEELQGMAEQDEDQDDNYGYYKDNNTFMIRESYSVDYTKYPDSAFPPSMLAKMVTTIEDELRYASNLPTGLHYKPAVTFDMTWVNGYVKDFYYVYDKVFTWNDVKYTYRTQLAWHYQVITPEEAEKYVPDAEEYDPVQYYYDL